MTAAFLILALAMLGALIYSQKAHARERQESAIQHEAQMRAAQNSARLEREAARRQLDAALAAASTTQAELIDRFHVPESKRLAAMQEAWALPRVPEPEDETPNPFPDDFALDPDDYVAGLMSPQE